MKLKFKLKKKYLFYIIGIFFVIVILGSTFFFSLPQKNDWYENKVMLYSFNRVDKFHFGNHSITNTYYEELFFKIIKVGDILVSLECDYAPTSQLSLFQDLLSNDSHIIILTKTFPEAFQYITQIPILNNSKISAIELLIFPPIVIESDWDFIQSNSEPLRGILHSRLIYANSLNVSIEKQKISFSYFVEIFDPFNTAKPTTNTSISIFFQFTKGGTLQKMSIKKETIFGADIYESTDISMQKRSIILRKLKTAQGIISVTTFIILIVIYTVFRRQRKNEQRIITKEKLAKK